MTTMTSAAEALLTPVEFEQVLVNCKDPFRLGKGRQRSGGYKGKFWLGEVLARNESADRIKVRIFRDRVDPNSECRVMWVRGYQTMLAQSTDARMISYLGLENDPKPYRYRKVDLPGEVPSGLVSP